MEEDQGEDVVVDLFLLPLLVAAVEAEAQADVVAAVLDLEFLGGVEWDKVA